MLPRRLQHLFRMPLDPADLPYPLDMAGGIDEEGGSHQPDIFPAEGLLLLPQAIRLHRLPRRIGSQDDAEAVLVAEGAVLLNGIGRYADHRHSQLLEFRQQSTEVDILEGTALDIVLRIEIQH